MAITSLTVIRSRPQRRFCFCRSQSRHVSAFADAPVEARRTNLTALTGPGRNSRLVRHRNGRFAGSSGGKRRPEPHGHKSFRPSFSTSSVSMPTMRFPRLTRDSLEGTPGGACWLAQKDAAVSWSRYMIVLPGRGGQEDRSQSGAAAATRFPPGDIRLRARYQRHERTFGWTVVRWRRQRPRASPEGWESTWLA